jgi:mycofactocin precursor
MHGVDNAIGGDTPGGVPGGRQLRSRAMENEEVVEPAADDAVIEEDLLIEEISIDGMCGVY